LFLPAQKNEKRLLKKGAFEVLLAMTSWVDVNFKQTNVVGGAKEHNQIFKCGLPVSSMENATVFWAQNAILD
jgi:hypothetical protein